MNDSKLSLLPTLLAVGGGIAAAPAFAIELGEANIQSAIGQPLRASIAYALGPNEQIASYCVSLNPGQDISGLPAITRARISVANGVIALTGSSAVREPLMSLRIDIKCPYTPTVSRDYMLFFDPAQPEAAAAIRPRAARNPVASPRSTASVPIDSTADKAEPARSATSPRRAAAATAPVDPSAGYRVQRGDTLSEIAARIENRPVGLWNAVAQIFEANPDAFIDNNPDRLKAGSLLVIPDFDTGRSFAVSTPADAPSSGQTPEPAAYETVSDSVPAEAGGAADPETETLETAAVDTVADNAAVADDASGDTAAAGTAAAPAADNAVDDTEVLQPAPAADVSAGQAGDDAMDAENPFVDGQGPTVVIPDTELEAPTTADSPNVPTASIAIPASQTPERTSGGWLPWLVGGGVLLIAALLLFGRRNRRFDAHAPTPADFSHQARVEEDVAVTESRAVEDELHDDAPTEENLALDADLDVGTGLRDTGMHVYEDFGFATETNLDIELPDDEDYDMSVIVDATKMREADEATQRDLKAVQVEDAVDDDPTDAYTIDQEIDYQILEQDYQNELTATQALNVEIEKAAAEIAKNLDQTDIDDLTSELQFSTESEIDDSTAEMPLNRRSKSDDSTSEVLLGNTGELTAAVPLGPDSEYDELTSEVPAALESEIDELTSEVPAALESEIDELTSEVPAALESEIDELTSEVPAALESEIDELTSEVPAALDSEIDELTSEVPAALDSEIDELTSEVPLASVTELGTTARLESGDAENFDGDPTGEITAANEELTLEEMVSEDFTVEMPQAEENTVQMPRKTNTK